MDRMELDEHLTKIDELVLEINHLVPEGGFRADTFRSDLAGLLVVAIAATYETCVKEILYEHANNHHVAFGNFAASHFGKLNSKIKVNDLEGYCKTFSPDLLVKFKEIMKTRKKRILDKTGKSIESCFEQILAWRHDFAHARIRTTTIEEALKTHRFGKRVIYILNDALNGS